MALVTWTPKMTVGVAKLDRQHQGLFDIMNQLHEGMLRGRGSDVLGSAITNLTQYTKVHFGEEESLLRSHGYPRLAEHLKMHETFRNKLAELDGHFKAGTAAIAVSTIDFLRDWLARHILAVDAEYKEFLNAKGVQ
jgi:hemerythrin-like metal-binding protein